MIHAEFLTLLGILSRFALKQAPIPPHLLLELYDTAFGEHNLWAIFL